jgi:hypothetical protein
MYYDLYKPQHNCQRIDVTCSALGIFYILGLVVYPAGWGAQRVQKLCGHEAAPFFPAECNLGKSFLFCISGDHPFPYIIITNLDKAMRNILTITYITYMQNVLTHNYLG